MGKEEKYILMNRDDEVLSFLVDFQDMKLTFLEKRERFDKAPYFLLNKEEDLNLYLSRFINGRKISPERWDFKLILEATGCDNGLELSFKGLGLSLMDHFWYKKEDEDLKYQDINFFTNKWDDSFARMVLKGDYEALKNCSTNVPDLVTRGWSVKGWIYDGGPKLYKTGIVKDHCEDCLGEVLASKLAQRILKEGEVTKYELRKVGDKYASVSTSFINIDEEYIPLSQVLPSRLHNIYLSKNIDKRIEAEFFKGVSEFGIPELYDFFIKLSVVRSIAFISDLHFENIAMIKNTKTGKLRVAPLFDLAGAFGSSEHGRNLIYKADKGLYLIVYYLFNVLNPKWDYSWYDSRKLVGFEEEMKEILSKSDFYTEKIIDMIIGVYHQQKEALDQMAKQ